VTYLSELSAPRHPRRCKSVQTNCHVADAAIQKTGLYCEEDRQHNKNAMENVPSAHKLPLKGEWSVCARGEVRDPRSSANVPNATPECVHHPSESRETEDAEEVESESCERGTSECVVSVDEADGDAGQGIESAGTPNELDALVTVSIESEDLGSGGIPHVCLGSTSWRACDANRPGHQTDGLRSWTDELRGQADESEGQVDASNASNRPETVEMSCGEGAGTYLGVGDLKHGGVETDGLGSQTDVLSGHWGCAKCQYGHDKAYKLTREHQYISKEDQTARLTYQGCRAVSRWAKHLWKPNGCTERCRQRENG